MRTAEGGAITGDTIKVTIGRFGSTTTEYNMPVDTTVERALEIAGLSGEEGDRFVNGERAENNNLLDDGDILNLVTSKEGGY